MAGYLKRAARKGKTFFEFKGIGLGFMKQTD